jgi:uncharacterized membrane protein YbhN (UPF0104 family)
VNRSALVRLVIGVAISVGFLALTLSQVNLARVGDAIAHAAPAGLLAALVIVIVDLGLRALRWQLLLHGVHGAGTRPSYRLAVGYLMIGFTANAVLPARLGDVARTVLAGRAFKTPRLAIFGTVMIERLGDGLTMLVLALVSTVLVAPIAELRNLALFALGAGVAGVIALGIGWLVVSRSAVGATRIGTLVAGIGRRLAAGAGTLTTVRGAAAVIGLTLTVAGTAMLVAWTVSSAVGVNLSPAQVVLFTSGIALSLAIPAAPGALGTYEFVGVSIVTALGFTPEQGLATILLMRILSTFPPAIAGLVSLWILQVRPSALVDAAEEGEDADLGAPEPVR